VVQGSEDAPVMMTRDYAPYGEVLAGRGTNPTPYGYTGEWTDASGLVYLRARYYSPMDGRFLSKDAWPGIVQQPLSQNRWGYVDNNPIRYFDPSGHIKEEEAKQAEEIYQYLLGTYRIAISKDWGYSPIISGPSIPQIDKCMWNEGSWKSLEEIENVKKAIMMIAPSKMPLEKAKKIWGGAFIRRLDNDKRTAFAPPGILTPLLGDIVLTNYTFSNGEAYALYGIIHELGHSWDYLSNSKLSTGLMHELNTWICDETGINCRWYPYAAKVNETTLEVTYPEPGPDSYVVCPPGPPDPKHPLERCKVTPYSATYGGFPLLTGPGAEDWAQSFAGYVYSDYFTSQQMVGVKPGSIRYNYIQGKIHEIQ